MDNVVSFAIVVFKYKHSREVGGNLDSLKCRIINRSNVTSRSYIYAIRWLTIEDVKYSNRGSEYNDENKKKPIEGQCNHQTFSQLE
ncbi:hypothetical protein [Caldivirga sp. UBA161]|uniref:hypothetical protein n=1 Tax=Caldivirga sp. UBA161 TaxID=1915569 RepID=UPI0025C1862F|nr:hypothetical protein [Caldivirga sp. UBA161]